MSLSFRFVVALLGVALAGTVLAQAATVYKWTDDKGVVQYTDAPPEGRKFQRLNVGGSGSRTDIRPAPEPENGATTGESAEAAPPSSAQSRLDAMKANCEMARKNLATLQNYRVINADVDGDGTAETLDAEGRQQAIEQSLELMRESCLDEAPAPAEGG